MTSTSRSGWATSGVGIAGKIFSATSSLLIARLVLKEVGTDNFGLIAIVVGISGWLALAELGFGPTLQNVISVRKSKGKPLGEILNFSGCLIFLGCIAFTGISICLAVVLSGSDLFKGASFGVLFVAFLGAIASAMGGVVMRIGLALNRGAISNTIPALCSFLTLSGVGLIGILPGQGNVMQCIFFMQVLPGVVSVLFGFVIGVFPFYFDIKYFRRSFRFYWMKARDYIFFTILGMAVLQVDYFFISNYLKSIDAAKYNVSMRVVGMVGLLCSTVLMSFWPFFAQKCADNQWGDALVVLRKILIGFFVFLLLCVFIVVEGRLWIFKTIFGLSETSMPSVWLILSVGLYWGMRMWTDAFAVFLQANNAVRDLYVPVLAQAVVGIVVIYQIVPYFGVVAIPLGLAVSFLLTVAWLLPLRLRILYRLKRGAL